MPSRKAARDHVKDDFLERGFLALPGGLNSCCRVSSNHQILSKLGMEWVPLPGLLSLPTPKLAEYKPFSRCDPGRLGGHPAQSRVKRECRQRGASSKVKTQFHIPRDLDPLPEFRLITLFDSQLALFRRSRHSSNLRGQKLEERRTVETDKHM